MTYRWALAAVVGVGGAVSSAQTTYYVNGACGDDAWTGTSAVCAAPDGPKRTIQSGIAASVTGDTVQVADGTYTGTGNRDLDFGGRNIVLRGNPVSPAQCVIDCEGALSDLHRGFHFHSGETTAARVEGFTIRNGLVEEDNGAAMACDGGTPSVRHCVFESNYAVGNTNGGGGAIYANGGHLSLDSCVFVDNRSDLAGGAVYFAGPGRLTIALCRFATNWAWNHGGAVAATGADSVITGVTLEDNDASNGDGAGVYASGGRLTVSECVIRGNYGEHAGGVSVRDGAIAHVSRCMVHSNTGSTFGGGLRSRDGADLTVVACSIQGNESGPSGGGGGICCMNATVTVINCLLAENLASEAFNGAGIAVFGGRVSVTGSTFVKNSKFQEGSAIVQFSGIAEARNCVFWLNGTDPIRGIVGVSYSNIEGGYPGSGNIALDPRFRAPDSGDYRLQPCSPCVDSGSNLALPVGLAFDLDGQPRCRDDACAPNTGVPGGPCGDAVADMGAYEGGRPCYGDCNGDGLFTAADFGCYQTRFVARCP